MTDHTHGETTMATYESLKATYGDSVRRTDLGIIELYRRRRFDCADCEWEPAWGTDESRWFDEGWRYEYATFNGHEWEYWS